MKKLGGRKLRRMARTPEWQHRFSMCKSSKSPLFDKPVSQWNQWQIWLAHWCSFYYELYRLDDRPGNHVIEDDFLLDEWNAQRRLKIETDKRKARLTASEQAGRTSHEEYK